MQTAVPQTSTTLFDAGFTRTIPGKIVLSLAATLVVAAAAHVSIPLWFTPVPLSLQPFAVLGVGLALGPFLGFMTMVAYLIEGAIGLPVFSPTGLGGVAQILGPTGGYLMAYPLVAFVVGMVTRALQIKLPRFAAAAIGCTAAVVLLFALGARWLMTFGHLTTHQVWIAAVAPFIPGEVIKIVIASGLYSSLTRLRRA
jgi:biotin transport system substrate-specific component